MGTGLRTVIDQTFFEQPVLEVAPELLGMYLCRGDRSAMITEVEAYDGPQDEACHGRFGKTDRTAVMLGPAGCWYVYLCYGMYWMLNIVTGEQGYPSAVLLRGVEGIDGPGKLTRDWQIDQSYNGMMANKETGLWIEDRGEIVKKTSITSTPRIGVDYAGAWAKKPYRFLLERN